MSINVHCFITACLLWWRTLIACYITCYLTVPLIHMLSIRPRRHDCSLTIKEDARNFVIRLLYKDIHVLVLILSLFLLFIFSCVLTTHNKLLWWWWWTLQLFLSFHPSNFHYHFNITHLQNALQQIPCWLTANLLTLNPSKTKFRSKIGLHDSTLSATHSARNIRTSPSRTNLCTF